MARKKAEEIENRSEILTLNMEDVFASRFETYAREIIPDRSLPDARDGLKPVQRRILYAMYKDGNTFQKPTRKSAKTVGLVIGNYHPHGDSSVYEAMVRLSQSWKMREPLVDMQGNNGSIDDDPAAAMRYTEARLSRIADLLLKDIDQDTVEFAPNFDDSENEPTVLPAAFPNLLVNGSKGMAIGYATNMPTHNLEEVTNAAIYLISHPDCTLEELMQFVQGPDFPTGGIVQGIEGIKDMYTSGQGKFIIRSRVSIEETKTCNQIVITEIPYEVVKSDLVRQIDDVRYSKDVQGILDVRDESDRTGLRIVVDVRKENDADMILNYLYKKTSLQVSYSANMTAIVNKRPVLMGLKDILSAFVNHRRDVTVRRCKYQLAKIEARCHILEGLIKVISILDDVIRVIRKSKDKADAKKNISEKFGFSEKQAEAIVTLQLYRLSSTDIVELKEEYAKLQATMNVLRGVLSHDELLRQLMIKELKEVITLCPSERRTEIQHEVSDIVISKEKMLVNERVMLTLSKGGYIKRVSLRSYNASDNTIPQTKDDDELIGYREVDLLDQLLVVTEAGNYLAIPVYEIEEFKWKDLGAHISSYTNLNGSEKIVAAYTVKSYKTDAWLITATQNGMIKRTPFNVLEPTRLKRLIPLMGLKKNDRLIDCQLLYRNEEVIIASHSGNVVRYQMNQIPKTSLKAQGVKAMNLAKDDTVAAFTTANEKSINLAVISEEGTSKRVKLSDIANMNRPVKGDSLYRKVKSHPSYVKYVFATQTYDEMRFLGEDDRTLVAKDITLMDKEASLSSNNRLIGKFYYLKGIEDVRIVDMVEEEEDTSVNDEVSLDADNSNSEFEVFSLNV